MKPTRCGRCGGPCRGCGRPRGTSADLEAVRQRLSEGATLKVVAAEQGLSPSRIGALVNEGTPTADDMAEMTLGLLRKICSEIGR